MTATSTLSAPSAGRTCTLHAGESSPAPQLATPGVFDFTVFSFLMLFIGPLFFPAASAYGQLLLTTGTFGVGFLMRPMARF
ncbi:hypothetical protein M5585_04425 [Serratia ureilytica]